MQDVLQPNMLRSARSVRDDCVYAVALTRSHGGGALGLAPTAHILETEMFLLVFDAGHAIPQIPRLHTITTPRQIKVTVMRIYVCTY